MQKPCQDDYHTTFSSYAAMLNYHEEQARQSRWKRQKTNELIVEPLGKGSTFSEDLSVFAAGTTQEALDDTVKSLGLGIWLDGELYPVRSTAYKSLLDRAKIGGTALPKLKREELASVLNFCLKMYSSEALLLIRDEKISAVHSGDAADYSILPVDELLKALQAKLDQRFAGSRFGGGYCDHSIVSAFWTLPDQKEELLGAYEKLLRASGKGVMAAKMVPGIRFLSSDVGVASAKVAALLKSGQFTIHVGSCIAVDHRHKKGIDDFDTGLDQLFAQFGETVEKLQKLLEIPLAYPVNAMTRICKKLSLPKKASVEAIAMYQMACGGGIATAHDVFFALQEIPFILRTQDTPESKLLQVEENLARVLSFNWNDYDLPKGWISDGGTGNILCDTAGMTNEQWLECRMHGPAGKIPYTVGGSDVAAIFGISPWTTPMELWMIKKGRMKPPVKSNVNQLEMGHLLEPIAAYWYEKKSGDTVIEDTNLYQHADHPYALANFDRRFIRASDGEPGILECKSCTYHKADEWKDGAIPFHYELQLRFYLAVADVKIGAFSAVWGNNPDNDLAMPRIERDQAKEDMIFERLDEWIWSLEHDKPPTMAEVTPKLAMESLARIYGASQGGLPTIEFSKKFEPSLRKIVALQDKISECSSDIRSYEKEITAHSVRIAEIMKEHEHGILETTTDKLLIDFVTKTTHRADSKALKEKYPAVYQEILKASESRKVKVSVQPV